ncbi:nucleoid-associated protein [Erythrobacter sp. 3-20A1M]|uniref:nucleoid-associated protein n=1 Tax=Erythrobacter sp. 3-20A1M TaxID=2653850 RepID=UPI001BFCC281|nr:nucleoid-associated protein [Erythrobacter sp. 3-20A1M]QWC57756.1 nucleoid-associated protein [Erythrobacter sp. 3-20A1M]
MNKIVALAIHDIERRDGTYQVQAADKQLAVTSTTQRVIDELYDLYNRRASKSHGRFTTAEGYPTQAQVRDYVEDPENDFLRLTLRMMETLRSQAQARSASTGGHVLFAHFRREGHDYLLVAIITDKLSAALTSQRDVRDVRHLDLDGFRFAGRINLTAWAIGDERYISFLKGKGDVSEYFRHFLGCDSVVQDRVDTSNLVAALKEFVAEAKMSEKEGNEFLGRAKAICERASRAREEIEFDALANELMPKDPKKLADHLAHTDRGLSDRFVPDRRALASLVRFRGGTKQWKVEFDRDAVSNRSVIYDAAANTLTLTGLPDDLVAQLKSEGLGGG